MAKVKLRCGVHGKGSVFSVDIERNADVEALQEVIAGILSTEQHTVPPRLLTLYLAGKNDAWLKDDDSLDVTLRGDVDTRRKKMRSSLKLTQYFDDSFDTKDGEVHVLVELQPQQQAEVTMVDQGWTATWVKEFRKNQLAPHQLPRLGELADFIENELPQKITLHQEIYDTWITKMTSPSPELMAKLFKIDNLKLCVNFLFRLGSRIVYATDPGDTETSFISFWDDLIRNILDFVLHNIGKSDRNSSRSASTGLNGPDYLFIVDDVCVFRGEEKDPGEQIETPRRELCDKLIWSYGDAPYLFGYQPLAMKPDYMLSLVCTLTWTQLSWEYTILSIWKDVFFAAGNSQRRTTVAKCCKFVPGKRSRSIQELGKPCLDSP